MDDLFTERACGRRVKGAVYAETRPSESGVPVEFFIVDPPRPVDLAALGLTAVGVKLVEVNNVWHVFDVVGRSTTRIPLITSRRRAKREHPADCRETWIIQNLARIADCFLFTRRRLSRTSRSTRNRLR